MSASKDVLSSAFHEIGHALAAKECGLTVKEVKVRPIWGGGYTRHGAVKWKPDDREGQKFCQWYVVICLAGDVFERKFRRENGFVFVGATGCGGDEREARAAIKGGARITIDKARKEAERLAQHRWGRATDLAELLARKHSLKGSQL